MRLIVQTNATKDRCVLRFNWSQESFDFVDFIGALGTDWFGTLQNLDLQLPLRGQLSNVLYFTGLKNGLSVSDLVVGSRDVADKTVPRDLYRSHGCKMAMAVLMQRLGGI
jgi:hypothetical protein